MTNTKVPLFISFRDLTKQAGLYQTTTCIFTSSVDDRILTLLSLPHTAGQVELIRVEQSDSGSSYIYLHNKYMAQIVDFKWTDFFISHIAPMDTEPRDDQIDLLDACNHYIMGKSHDDSDSYCIIDVEHFKSRHSEQRLKTGN